MARKKSKSEPVIRVPVPTGEYRIMYEQGAWKTELGKPFKTHQSARDTLHRLIQWYLMVEATCNENYGEEMITMKRHGHWFTLKIVAVLA